MIMKYTALGKSGMKVSRLCLGTMNFGPATDEKKPSASWILRLTPASISSTRPMSTAGARTPD